MVCERMVDFDEGFQEWRYRHVKMVERARSGASRAPAAPRPRTCHDPQQARLPRPLVGSQRAVIELDELRRSPNVLASDYSAFRVADRLLLTGHSHQGLARRRARRPARGVRGRRAARRREVGSRVREGGGFGTGSGSSSASRVRRSRSARTRMSSSSAFSRHWTSASPPADRPMREFCSTSGLARLDEAGLEVVRLEVKPVDTLAERMAWPLDERTSAVLVSAVLFEIRPHRSGPRWSSPRLAPGPESAPGRRLPRARRASFGSREEKLESAWIVGGYKYLQLGEDCFLRLPPQADGCGRYSPAGTPSSSFSRLSGTTRRSGSRQAKRASPARPTTPRATTAPRVFFFEERGLTPELLRASYLHQTAVLAAGFDSSVPGRKS